MQFQRVAQIQAQLDSLLFNRSAEQSEIHPKLSEVNAGRSSATRWERTARSNVITTNAYRRRPAISVAASASAFHSVVISPEPCLSCKRSSQPHGNILHLS